MSSEQTGWTLETLYTWTSTAIDEREKRYEQRFEAQEKATNAAIESSRLAVTKAESAIEKRLENTNEWRQAMNDRDQKLLPRLEYDRAHIDLEKRLEEYKKSIDERLETLTRNQVRAEGRGIGLNAGWAYLVGAIGILFGIFALFKGMDRPTLQPTLPMQIAPPQQTTPLKQP